MNRGETPNAVTEGFHFIDGFANEYDVDDDGSPFNGYNLDNSEEEEKVRQEEEKLAKELETNVDDIIDSTK